MKTFLAVVLLALVSVAKGQDMPMNQFYIGYELQRPNLSLSQSGFTVTSPRRTFNGMQVSDTVRVYRWLGAEGNFGVGYKQADYTQLVGATNQNCDIYGNCVSSGSTNIILFGLGGPRVQYSFGRVEPYGHFLLGTEHVHLDAASPATANGAAYSTNAFALGGGGGVVLHVSRHFGIAGGLDYLHASKNISGLSFGTNTLRVTVGPTFTWGGGGHNDRMSTKMRQPSAVSSGETALPLLGVVVDSHRRIIMFYTDSVLSSHGLELGDVITGVNDNMASTSEELTSLMSNLTKGTTVKVQYLSRGQWQSWISVKL